MNPRTAVKWIGEIEVARRVEDLETSTSVRGKKMPDFEVTDSMVGSGVRKKSCKETSRRHVSTAESEAQKKICFLHWASDSLGELPQFPKLSGGRIELKNDSVQAFGAKWDKLLSSVSERPPSNFLDSIYRLQLD